MNPTVARIGDRLYRNAPVVCRPLYGNYKSWSVEGNLPP